MTILTNGERGLDADERAKPVSQPVFASDDGGTTVTATEAARNLSDLLSRVRYRGECFDVTRGGEAVARLTPPSTPPTVTVRDLVALLAGHAADPDFAEDLDPEPNPHHEACEEPCGT